MIPKIVGKQIKNGWDQISDLNLIWGKENSSISKGKREDEC